MSAGASPSRPSAASGCSVKARLRARAEQALKPVSTITLPCGPRSSQQKKSIGMGPSWTSTRDRKLSAARRVTLA
ncbi:hypothetical protein D3C72_2424230 [compost metagenome]